MSTKKLENLTKHWRSKNRKAGAPDPKKPVTLRRRRQNIKVKANWDYFYYSFYDDHARADLIWNFKTREELREAIEGELRAFTADKDLRGDHLISWNHTEFELRYVSTAYVWCGIGVDFASLAFFHVCSHFLCRSVDLTPLSTSAGMRRCRKR